MIRKGRSASAPTTPRDTGRPRDGQPGGPRSVPCSGQRNDQRSDPASRDIREGGRGSVRLERDVFDAPVDSERDSDAGDSWAAGEPPEPFGQFDEFETSFGAFESASDTSGADASRIATPGVDTADMATPDAPDSNIQPIDRFERTSTARANRPGRARAAAVAESPESPRPGRSLKGRALAYLSRREYSRAELSRKLMPFTDDADALEVLLDALVRDGWLSDARFAESVIHRRAARLGATRIVSELKRHAVGDTLIEEVSAQLRETELARARAVWRKKYGDLPATPAERARQARFLAARGFSMSIIGKILKGIEDDWTEN